MNSLRETTLRQQRSFVLLLSAVLSTTASAAIDTFEDGTTGNWQYSTTGGLSTMGVEVHNSSKMAYVFQTGSGPINGSTTTSSSLAQDFSYLANDILSFAMHAVANTASGNPSGIKHSGSGVRVSFLNAFNVPLGSFGLYNYTNPTLLGANEYAIDNVQHNYSATMGTFASQAGLNPQSAISKVSLTFVSWAQYSGGGNIYPNVGASASVWFDNAGISPVPEPHQYPLMAAGLFLISLVVSRNRRHT